MAITFQDGRDSFEHQKSVITSLKKEQIKYLSLGNLFSDAPLPNKLSKGMGISLAVQLFAQCCKSTEGQEIAQRSGAHWDQKINGQRAKA